MFAGMNQQAARQEQRSRFNHRKDGGGKVLLSATTTGGLHPKGERNAVHMHFISRNIRGHNLFSKKEKSAGCMTKSSVVECGQLENEMMFKTRTQFASMQSAAMMRRPAHMIFACCC